MMALSVGSLPATGFAVDWDDRQFLDPGRGFLAHVQGRPAKQPIRYVFNRRLVAEVGFENSLSRAVFNNLIHGYLRLWPSQHARHNLIIRALSHKCRLFYLYL